MASNKKNDNSEAADAASPQQPDADSKQVDGTGAAQKRHSSSGSYMSSVSGTPYTELAQKRGSSRERYD